MISEILTMVTQNNNIQAYIIVICYISTMGDEFWEKDVNIKKKRQIKKQVKITFSALIVTRDSGPKTEAEIG